VHVCYKINLILADGSQDCIMNKYESNFLLACKYKAKSHTFYENIKCIPVRAVASGGAVVPGPPFEIGAPPFHVWTSGCCIHPILYFKKVPTPSGFFPSFLFLAFTAAKSWRRAWHVYNQFLIWKWNGRSANLTNQISTFWIQLFTKSASHADRRNGVSAKFTNQKHTFSKILLC